MDYSNGTPPRILIVDDMEANTAVLEAMIETLGYKARSAYSVRQALEIMDKELPQVILSDISMPDLDGYQFCKILKKDIRTREIPLIFISVISSTEEKIKGLRLGAVDFITKPFALEEVTVRINTCLKLYTMQKEMENYNYRLNAIINEQSKKIEEGQKNILFAIAAMSERKEMQESGNHLQTVSLNAHLLAQSLAFSPKFEGKITNLFVDTIGIAALLHDIGKITMPDRFHSDKNLLKEEELEQLKEHPERGAKLLEEIRKYCGINEFLTMAIEIARYHHECWDGSGYPYGIQGEKIPLAARIVKIVCSYDELTCNEIYRKALSPKEALQMMLLEKGKKFDPQIMDVFEKVVKQFVSAEVR